MTSPGAEGSTADSPGAAAKGESGGWGVSDGTAGGSVRSGMDATEATGASSTTGAGATGGATSGAGGGVDVDDGGGVGVTNWPAGGRSGGGESGCISVLYTA